MLAAAFRLSYQPVVARLIPTRRCNLACAYCNECDASSLRLFSPPRGLTRAAEWHRAADTCSELNRRVRPARLDLFTNTAALLFLDREFNVPSSTVELLEVLR
jgi:hypothetical protein